MREIFERLLKKPEERKATEVKEKEDVKQVTHISWLTRKAIKCKIFWSELNPFNTVFMLIILSFLIVCIVGFILPAMGILEEIPYTTSILGGILVFSFSWALSNHFNKNIRNRICNLSLEDGNVLCDNSKIDAYEGGDVLYLVDATGRAILNKEEENLIRYNLQKTIFIPKNVVNAFGSILGRRAKSYPDCKIRDIYNSKVDLSIIYLPKKVSESRLLKKVEIVEENLVVTSEIITQLRDNIIITVKNLRGHKSEELKSLITQVSSLQEIWMSTPTKLKQLLEEQFYKAQGSRYGRYGSSYSPYRSFGGSYGSYGSPMPRWGDLESESKPINLHKEDQEGEE